MWTGWPGYRGALTPTEWNAQVHNALVDRDERAGGTERALANCFLTLRLLALVQGGVVTVIAWSAYRHPILAVVALVGSGVESAVVVCWSRRPPGLRQPGLVALDVGWAFVGLLLMGFATTEVDRTAWVNWMPPFTYSSTAVVAVGVPGCCGPGGWR